MKKVLITGGSGMIGKKLNFGLKPSSTELNVCDTKSIKSYLNRINENELSCIIHLASINLRDSQENPSKTIDININGTINMLSISKKLNIPFVLLSSGAVFSSDNQTIIYNENNIPNPNCIYGYSKAASEKVAELYEKSIIIRTGWLFGGNQKTHYKFVENTINSLLTNSIIKASNDFYGSPTYVVDLIEKMCNLITNSNFGIHHVVNSEHATGYEMALEIAKYLNKNSDNILSVSSRNVPNAGPYRGKTEMLESLNDYNYICSWKESLEKYVNFYITQNMLSENLLSKEIIIKSENQIWKNRDKCRLCNSSDLQCFYKFIPTPPANHFLKIIKKQEEIPLDVCICIECNHIQLLQIVDCFYQYTDYIYVSSTSETMKNHLKNNTKYFIDYLNLSKNDNILEIGSNDGICIKYLLDSGFLNVVGIDPAKNIHRRHKLPIICDFFGINILNSLKDQFKSFKLIFGFHCCAHIENILDVFKTVYELLHDDGTFIMEVGYFYEVFKNKLFDTIYHEHIDYHTCTAIQKFALTQNLLLYNVVENNIQSGSIQFYFCKNNNLRTVSEIVYQTIKKEKEIGCFNFNNLISWKNDILKNIRDLNYILNSFVGYGKKIIGYGASAKSTTFLYQCGLTKNIIDYIIDDNIYKQNHFSPGLHIPIKSINILEIDKVDYIIILSWNFSEEIIKQLRSFTKNDYRIIIPFPEIKII